MSPSIVSVDRNGAVDCRAAASPGAGLPGQRRVDLGCVNTNLLTVGKSDEGRQDDEGERHLAK